MAKCALNLTKATSSSQNADLMEALLLALEEKMERRNIYPTLSLQNTPMANGSASSSSSSSSCSLSVPIPVATSTPRSRTSLPFSDPVSPTQQHADDVQSSRYVPQKSQISTPATEDDNIYLCSEGALRTLFSFFSNSLSAKCCYCGKPLDSDSISFSRQSHTVSVRIFCMCGDSFKWLSSPIMGGSTPKYYVNMR